MDPHDDLVKRLHEAELSGDVRTAGVLRRAIDMQSSDEQPDGASQVSPDDETAAPVSLSSINRQLGTIRRNTTVIAWALLTGVIASILGFAIMTGRFAAAAEQYSFRADYAFWAAFWISILTSAVVGLLSALVLWLLPKE